MVHFVCPTATFTNDINGWHEIYILFVLLCPHVCGSVVFAYDSINLSITY